MNNRRKKDNRGSENLYFELNKTMMAPLVLVIILYYMCPQKRWGPWQVLKSMAVQYISSISMVPLSKLPSINEGKAWWLLAVHAGEAGEEEGGV